MDKKRKIKYLRQLYENAEKDLVNVEIQCWIYQKEFDNPVNIGKGQAKQNLDIYQKRLQFLKENLEVYKNYAWEVLEIEL